MLLLTPLFIGHSTYKISTMHYFYLLILEYTYMGLDFVLFICGILCLNDESFPGNIAGAHFQTSWLLQAFASWVTLLHYMNWRCGGFVLLSFKFVFGFCVSHFLL